MSLTCTPWGPPAGYRPDGESVNFQRPELLFLILLQFGVPNPITWKRKASHRIAVVKYILGSTAPTILNGALRQNEKRLQTML